MANSLKSVSIFVLSRGSSSFDGEPPRTSSIGKTIDLMSSATLSSEIDDKNEAVSLETGRRSSTLIWAPKSNAGRLEICKTPSSRLVWAR